MLVPLPYVALIAVIHARRTAGPALARGARCWRRSCGPPSIVLADFLYEHLTFGEEPAGFLDRFAFWWGAPYVLLPIALFAAPVMAGAIVARRTEP